MFVSEPIVALIAAILVTAFWAVANLFKNRALLQRVIAFNDLLSDKDRMVKQLEGCIKEEQHRRRVRTAELNQTRERVKYLESRLESIQSFVAGRQGEVEIEAEIEIGDRVKSGKGNCVYEVVGFSPDRKKATVRYDDGQRWQRDTEKLVKVP